MRLFLLVWIAAAAMEVRAQQFHRRMAGEPGTPNRIVFPQHYFNHATPALIVRNDPAPRKLGKKTGVPPYAVLMEPLVQYSQPDPLYNSQKQPASDAGKTTDGGKNDLVKKSFVTVEQTKEEVVKAESRIHRPRHPYYEDSDGDATHQVEFSSYGQLYEGGPPESPEPIIEIIIKESNQSLPAPPPLPPPPKKKKKEPVQVFYVKYKKDPSAYGEDKVIYEQPVPAVTPHTNEDSSHEEEEEEHEEPEEHYEAATLPPAPSTTLKAIIRPDSETFHGSGLHITFGEPHEDDTRGHHHPGNYEQQSAPQPAVVFPSPSPQTPSPRVGAPSQLTKRNPGPFPQPQQQNFQSPVTQAPFVPSHEHHRQPGPTPYQQPPQFPAQQFKPTYHHPAPLQAQPPPRPQQYSTLPQHLQGLPPPVHQFAPPRQPPVQPPLQYQTINPQHFNPKPVFPNPRPQQYHTINQHNPALTNYHTLPQQPQQPQLPAVNFAEPQRPFLSPQPQLQPQPQQQPQPTPQRPFPTRPPVRVTAPDQAQHQQQVEQLNRLQQQQQYLQAQIQAQHGQTHNFGQVQQYSSTYAPEIIKSISPQEARVPFAQPVDHKPQPTPQKPVLITTAKPTTTTTTEEPVTEDPAKAEEDRKRKAETHKMNVAALPDEVPDELREQLLSSGILGNADIQILDYDKIGDIPIESLPPEALANFQAATAGSHPVPSVAERDSSREEEDDALPAPSEKQVVAVKAARTVDPMEMKVVRFNPESSDGAAVPDRYMTEDATQLEPVVLNDSKYNRYLPLKVSGAQFPVPDVPELRGRNVTSVVVLAPVDYEFLQRRDKEGAEGESRVDRRSATPVLEVQGVHFVAGDVLKTLVKTPTVENYRRWLAKENMTSADKQSVVLLVVEPSPETGRPEKEIFMFDIGSQRVSKLRGELSATFVEVAESNSHNEDLDEISDSASAPGGDFTVKEPATVAARRRRKLRSSGAR